MERGSLGASGWSWEAAGEGGRRRRSWEPRAGPSDCPGLQVASAPRQPQLILMHLLWIHGWGRGAGTPGLFPALHWGEAHWSLGDFTFQIRTVWLHPQGLWCGGPGWAWTPPSFSCPQAPLTWSGVSGGFQGITPARHPHSQGSLPGGKEPSSPPDSEVAGAIPAVAPDRARWTPALQPCDRGRPLATPSPPQPGEPVPLRHSMVVSWDPAEPSTVPGPEWRSQRARGCCTKRVCGV